MTKQVLTANRLSDGAVVFLTELGAWSETVNDARVARSADDGERLLAIGKTHETTEIVGPYLVDVVEEAQDIVPISYRERIRAYGPSLQEPFALETRQGHFKTPVSAAAGTNA